MALHRIYIDESGHHRYMLAGDVKERYLCLCGIIIEKNEYVENIIPRIEAIRSLFYPDPDFKPAIHLDEIINKKGSFTKLKDPEVEKKFNELLFSLYSEVDYKIIAVVIDKARHYNQYVTPEHPYHYCLTCLLERYYKFLAQNRSRGDVMAEVRGKKEDAKLKDVYDNFYNNGTYYLDNCAGIQGAFTSKDIKLKGKYNFIQGLEFADFLAKICKYDVLQSYGKVERADNFNQKIIDLIQPRYFRGARGVKGNGKKFI